MIIASHQQRSAARNIIKFMQHTTMTIDTVADFRYKTKSNF